MQEHQGEVGAPGGVGASGRSRSIWDVQEHPGRAGTPGRSGSTREEWEHPGGAGAVDRPP